MMTAILAQYIYCQRTDIPRKYSLLKDSIRLYHQVLHRFSSSIFRFVFSISNGVYPILFKLFLFSKGYVSKSKQKFWAFHERLIFDFSVLISLISDARSHITSREIEMQKSNGHIKPDINSLRKEAKKFRLIRFPLKRVTVYHAHNACICSHL